ncbi:putative jasmonic acid carboxyl methyltransferase 1 isoform X1 [Tasmannia lanceolata]|uniref:putative jasmonic acid carboxyl methyltransferase 1 isoform X1 n=1 Tax=Tasmannia lanceolata TaxID=3420 RepID=UPI004063D7EB
MEVQQVLHMNGGVGDTSYANNSLVQRNIISKGMPMLEDAILDLYCTSFPEKLSIADLGCSSGPNTLFVISHIIDTIKKKCHQLNIPLPEFQMFLNDLLGNDFNNLFSYLPDFYEKLKEEKHVSLEQCFVAGVAGSFHGRLFPIKSLHFIHSANSLHWLSQVPQGLQNEMGISLNKGKIYIGKTNPPSVFKAYLAQFQRDFYLFLKSRSEEVIGGGRMVLTLCTGRSSDPSIKECFFHWELLAQTLNDMVSQGVIDQDKVDSFNLPFYAPSIQELEAIVNREGSFSLDRHEVIEIVNFTSGQNVAKLIRAITESMLADQFGAGILDDLFRRYEHNVDVYLSNEKAIIINLVLSMTRKE